MTTTMNKHTLSTSSIATLLATLSATLMCAGAAQAQQAGSWLVRVGATSVMPQVKSGELSTPAPPNTRIDAGSSTVLAGGVSHMLTDHWSVDIPLALPFKNTIEGAGAISGSGELGEVQVVPITGFLQYRFREASAPWRPYLGAGLTYANFIQETGNGTLTGLTNPGGPPTTLKLKDKLGLSVQAGLTWQVAPKVFVEGLVGYTFLRTRATLNTGQTIDLRLNPVSLGLYVGYRY